MLAIPLRLVQRHWSVLAFGVLLLAGCSGGGDGGDGDGGTLPPPTQGAGGYTLLAWNDLGMHCMDGADYSVFSILPPFNNLHAQLLKDGRLIAGNVSLTFQALADESGSINSRSADKTNFWEYAQRLFGVDLASDTGLAGVRMPELAPQPLAYNSQNGWFEAVGIPITPVDDNGHINTYPLVKVVARDAAGAELATARVVLPVSNELNCIACHASGRGVAAMPAAGWVNHANAEKDWKLNILRLHDQKQGGNAAFTNALAQKGYLASGLEATAGSGQPILCAACHASNALPGSGIAGISPLTQALHSRHAGVSDPVSGVKLGDSGSRDACYLCHPGSVTQCLRGVMGKATDATGQAAMSCQSCHGGMAHVGAAGRAGWLAEPACQSCHHDGLRETSAVDAQGNPRLWGDNRFATNANVPAAGFDLYRFSKEHGGLQCEACHGATHAEYPSSHNSDNLLSQDVQGHAGTIVECEACHKAGVPITSTGGPHGLHTLGQTWVSRHGGVAEHGRTGCQACHGSDYRGAPLSAVKVDRSFQVKGRTVNFAAGHRVGCYDCHNGPGG